MRRLPVIRRSHAPHPDLPGVLACTLAHHHSEGNLEDGA